MVAFAFLTPFFFVKGGMNVSLGAVFSNLGLLGILLAAKMLPKLGLVYPLARRAVRRHGDLRDAADEHRTNLRHHLVALRPERRHHRQDAVLAAGDRGGPSAVVPTAIAERWFLPQAERERPHHRREAFAESEEYV